MTEYKTLSSVFRKTTALILISASITIPLSAAAAECSFLSAEFHSAATEVADRFKVELRLELTKTVRLPALPKANSVVASAQMDAIVEKDQPMPSHVEKNSRGTDI